MHFKRPYTRPKKSLRWRTPKQIQIIQKNDIHDQVIVKRRARIKYCKGSKDKKHRFVEKGRWDTPWFKEILVSYQCAYCKKQKVESLKIEKL